MSTWVKLHRRLLEWEWVSDPTVLSVFIQILLRTNHEDKRWRGHAIPRGSFITSRETLAEACGLSEKQVRRALDVLEMGRTISRKRAGAGQLVTLEKWEEYQSDARTRAGRGPTTGPVEVQPQGRSRAATEEVEEEKKGRREEGKNNFKSDSVELPLDVKVEIILPWQTETFAAAWSLWKKYKAEKGARYKPIGEQAALNKLAKEYASEAAAIAAIENSMAQNYQGIFPPKTHTFTNGARTDEERNAASRAALDKILAERRTAGAGA